VFAVNADLISYDGNGQVVRQVAETRIGTEPFSTSKRHFVRSSALGGAVIGEMQDNGSSLGSDPNRFENRTYMYLNGERIAYQKYTDRTGPDKEVVWVYKHPVIGSLLETNTLTRSVPPGAPPAPVEFFHTARYFDPLGSDLGFDPATQPPPVQVDDPLAQLQFGDITNYSSGCVMDGVRTNCNIVQSMLNNGWAAEVPWGVSGLTWNTQSQVWQSAEGFVVDWDSGFFGFVPQGATYAGNGIFKPNKSRNSGSQGDYENGDYGDDADDAGAGGTLTPIQRFGKRKPLYGYDWSPNTTVNPTVAGKFNGAFEAIQTKICENFVNATLQSLGINKTFNDLLRDAKFNYYNPNDPAWKNPSSESVKNYGGWEKFEYDRRNGLADAQASTTYNSQIYLTVNFADNRINQGRVIVHELFHVAGVKSYNVRRFWGLWTTTVDPVSKLDDEIRKHCGYGGGV
jgi:hypothetical protein